jgi:two-component system cell cycle response regulator DivK
VGQKILVVEDNELNLKLFCDLLRAHGYEAEPVRDGREAVARARSFGPELVIMDIQMPYITGLELIEQMKGDEELRRTPIMAVTAYAAKGDEQRIRDAGAEGYVSKPISLMRFIEAVRGLLAAAEAERQAEASPQAEAARKPEPADLEAAVERAEAAEPEAMSGVDKAPEPDDAPSPDEGPGVEEADTKTETADAAPSETEEAEPAAEDPGEPETAPGQDTPGGARLT